MSRNIRTSNETTSISHILRTLRSERTVLLNGFVTGVKSADHHGTGGTGGVHARFGGGNVQTARRAHAVVARGTITTKIGGRSRPEAVNGYSRDLPARRDVRFTV